MKKYLVYILASELSGRFYIGQTMDLNKRLNAHNSGACKSTRPYRLWKVLYFEKFYSRSAAYKREQYFKTRRGREELKKILV